MTLTCPKCQASMSYTDLKACDSCCWKCGVEISVIDYVMGPAGWEFDKEFLSWYDLYSDFGLELSKYGAYVAWKASKLAGEAQ